MAVKVNEDGSLEFDKYVHRGNMMYLREGLSINDPDHLYNYLKNNNIEPELYGIYHPIMHKYEDYTRDQLLSKVCELEQTIKNIEQYI